MIALALLSLAAPAAAACTPSYPPALKAWPDAHPLAHGFVVGRTVELTPVTAATLRFAAQPSRPLSGSHLAIGSFAVKTAGTYQVAAGGVAAPVRPLWLDVNGADGQPLKSVAHGHGAACTSITKVVEYRLVPGKYTFLATGLTSAAPVRVLIVPKP